MISKRPHTLLYKEPPSAPTMDGDGNWIPGTDGVGVALPCRYEPNGGAKEIAGPDGTNVLYNGVVYLDKGAEPVPYGTPIEVHDGANIIATGSVIRFSQGQMNSRIWA